MAIQGLYLGNGNCLIGKYTLTIAELEGILESLTSQRKQLEQCYSCGANFPKEGDEYALCPDCARIEESKAASIEARCHHGVSVNDVCHECNDDYYRTVPYR